MLPLALSLLLALAPAPPPAALDALTADAEKAVEEGGLSAAELEALGRRALALASTAAEPRDAIRAAGAALRLSQHRASDPSARLRAAAVERLLARRFDAGPLPEEAWADLYRAVDALRRPEAGELRASRAAMDEYLGLLRRIEARAASDRLRAIARAVETENRLVIDRLFGSLTPDERRAVVARARDGIARWGALRVGPETTYAQAVRGPLRELELLHVGAAAPEIAGVDLDGAPMKLSDYRGRVVLLDFWASWCPPCIAAVPQQKELLARLAGRPFAIVGVSGDEKAEDGRAAAERHGAAWRSFWAYWPGADGKAEPLKDTWYVRFWPTYYVLDPEGRIRYKGSWDEDMAEIARVVEGLLPPPR